MWTKNIGVWFDIPVADIDRAKKFYNEVFNVEFLDLEHNKSRVAMFPFERGLVSGTLVENPDYVPPTEGPTIYFNGGNDLNDHLSKVEKAGGEILNDKFSIKEYGYIAYFKDTEGNKIGIHSME